MMIRADARHIPLASGSVQCCVTSPPYWGLRDYGLGERGIGLEATPELYVEQIVAVFREVWRVLRDDGTCWVNLGDSYASNPTKGGSGPGGKNGYGEGYARPMRKGSGRADGIVTEASPRNRDGCPTPPGLKSKDLVGIPWRVAFALQADGWYLRSDIIWAKPNPMPESVTDRPTKAHEYIFLLTKSERYFFDQEAVREPQTGNAHARGNGDSPKGKLAEPGNRANSGFHVASAAYVDVPGGRNIRTVWNIATQPYAEAHFATFPEELPRRCIAAGTSERGCCAKCGAPWERIFERTELVAASHKCSLFDAGKTGTNGAGRVQRGERFEKRQIGWKPTCACDCGEPTIPALVLDPFAGSGTVGEVAFKMGRRFVLLDLKYQELQARRVPPMARLMEGSTSH